MGCGTFTNVRQSQTFGFTVYFTFHSPSLHHVRLRSYESFLSTDQKPPRSQNMLNTPQWTPESATQNVDETPRHCLPVLQPITPTPTSGHVEWMRSNVRASRRTTRENNLQASPRCRWPAAVQDENCQPGLFQYTQTTQMRVRFLNYVFFKDSCPTFGKESQVEIANGRPGLQASTHQNRPLSPPSTQLRLLDGQSGCRQIPPSVRSLAQRKRRECERVARQQAVSAMPVSVTDLSTTQARQRRESAALPGQITMPPTPPATQQLPNNHQGKYHFLILLFKVW